MYLHDTAMINLCQPERSAWGVMRAIFGARMTAERDPVKTKQDTLAPEADSHRARVPYLAILGDLRGKEKGWSVYVHCPDYLPPEPPTGS